MACRPPRSRFACRARFVAETNQTAGTGISARYTFLLLIDANAGATGFGAGLVGKLPFAIFSIAWLNPGFLARMHFNRSQGSVLGCANEA